MFYEGKSWGSTSINREITKMECWIFSDRLLAHTDWIRDLMMDCWMPMTDCRTTLINRVDGGPWDCSGEW